MRLLFSIILSVAFFATVQAQSIKIPTRVDSATVSFSEVSLTGNEEDDSSNAINSIGYQLLVDQLDIWSRRSFRRTRVLDIDEQAIRLLARAVNQVYPDSANYAAISSKYDSVYSKTNDSKFDSRLIFPDTSFDVNIYWNANSGRTIMRIKGDTGNTNFPVSFIEGENRIRVGSSSRPLPIVGDFIELQRRVEVNIKDSEGNDVSPNVHLFTAKDLQGRFYRLRWRKVQ